MDKSKITVLCFVALFLRNWINNGLLLGKDLLETFKCISPPPLPVPPGKLLARKENVFPCTFSNP